MKGGTERSQGGQRRARERRKGREHEGPTDGVRKRLVGRTSTGQEVKGCNGQTTENLSPEIRRDKLGGYGVKKWSNPTGT